jgi:CubicO group peptidase (beta-lactamase class C family)
MRFRLALATSLLAVSGGACAATPAGDGGDHAARVSARILAEMQEASGVPGLGAAIWRDGRVAWTGSAGQRDVARGLPVDENTIFRFASVSKIFAVAAAARLREVGRLDVDAPVASVLPYLSNDWPAINTRQLAAHISGLPHYQDVDAERGGRHFDDMRESVALFSNRALLSPPGTAYSYSSWGYTLLSAEVEAAAHMSYLAYLARAITPGLVIGPDATASGNPEASRAYEIEDGRVAEAAPHDYSYSWGGAGLGGTPRDLATFGGRLLNGRVVSPATFAWMQEPVRLADGSPAGEDGYQLGFGLRVERDEDGQRLAHHSGVTNGARSVLLLYPDSDVAVSILSNALWVSSIERSARTLSAPFRAAPGDLPARACPVEAARYRGSYGDQPIEGTARFRVEDGICIGELSVANAFGAWMNGPPQRDATTVRLIGIDVGSGFSRAAVVTPVGAYELRAGTDGYASRIGPTRTLTLRFQS